MFEIAHKNATIEYILLCISHPMRSGEKLMQSRYHLLLWILLTMLLMSCSTQSPPRVATPSPTTPNDTDTLSANTPLINRYYQDLKEQKPEMAYTYVSSDVRRKGQKVTKAGFVQMARNADQEFGPIQSFSSELYGNDPSRVTMTITRTNNPRYHCHLQIKSGKIIFFDTL